jgi:hypothetical protein
LLIPDEAFRVLLDAGVTVAAVEAREADRRVDLVLSVPDGTGSTRRSIAMEVKRYSYPLSAASLESVVLRWKATRHHSAGRPVRGRSSDISTSLLLVVPSATQEATAKAVELGVCLIALNDRLRSGPTGHLISASTGFVPLGSSPQEAERGRKSSRTSWGTWVVIRSLLLLGDSNQTELAGHAGVTQPRVSQIVTQLGRQQLLRPGAVDNNARSRATTRSTSRPGWEVATWNGLLTKWRTDYPGPGGVSTHWYGLKAPLEQAHDVVRLLTRSWAEPSDSPAAIPALVSGDVAADLVTPWATPARATIYAPAGVDLAEVGLTPCPAPDATLVLVTPQDPGVWRFVPHVWRLVHADPAPRRLPLADPLQILYDVGRSPSVDVDQMSSRLEDLVTRVRTASENNAAGGAEEATP